MVGLREEVLPVELAVSIPVLMAEMSLPEVAERKTPAFDRETIPDWKKLPEAESFDFAQTDSTAVYRRFCNPAEKRPTKTIPVVPTPCGMP